MSKLEKLIQEQADRYPQFVYHTVLLEKAQRNITSVPDISIECSKALLEGICKTILKTVDFSYRSADYKSSAGGTSSLFKAAVKKVAEFNDEVDVSVFNAHASFVCRTYEIRNLCGDICHGKHSPKDYESTANLSLLVFTTTEALLFYIMTIFYKTAFPKDERVLYEDNEDFNSQLDEDYSELPFPYSKAFYDTCYNDYCLELEAYNESLIEEDA